MEKVDEGRAGNRGTRTRSITGTRLLEAVEEATATRGLEAQETTDEYTPLER